MKSVIMRTALAGCLSVASLSVTSLSVTHAHGILLGAGIAYDHSHTVGYERQLSAGATGEVSVTRGANWKIAELDATVSYSLSANPSKTTTGSWKQLTCSRAPGVGTWYTGGVHSYQPTEGC